MPPSDLTRFDFHVVRFMNSYDVEIMTKRGEEWLDSIDSEAE